VRWPSRWVAALQGRRLSNAGALGWRFDAHPAHIRVGVDGPVINATLARPDFYVGQTIAWLANEGPEQAFSASRSGQGRAIGCGEQRHARGQCQHSHRYVPLAERRIARAQASARIRIYTGVDEAVQRRQAFSVSDARVVEHDPILRNRMRALDS
jgi:hypothetical protein